MGRSGASIDTARDRDGSSTICAVKFPSVGYRANDGRQPFDAVAELAARFPFRDTFEERRDAGVEAFRNAGLTVDSPKATMYLWIELPGGGTSADFARRLLENEAVAVMPGSAFGNAGEGYFRIALTVGSDRLAEAGARQSRELKSSGVAGVEA